MNPMTMYAAVQIVAERRRDTEATAQRRRIARRGADPLAPGGRVRWLRDHRHPAAAAERAVA